ncbi:hypothetical protein GLYMA_20G218000v4 [Glycine max]|uniref:Uncharacterized protein n=1 Tax=Glycine max TaxID=3847 RepID=A0A0R0EPL2_SOYBN|nr:hypothetical protein JHK85_057966 [Glycine max]KRG92545.1 hypothetical protein GLYMA_20G218000v4 [Glycine max]
MEFYCGIFPILFERIFSSIYYFLSKIKISIISHVCIQRSMEHHWRFFIMLFISVVAVVARSVASFGRN